MLEKTYNAYGDEQGGYIEYSPQNLPPMYMFLPINVYSIDHFANEELWGSLPRTFNDPFDSLPTVEKDELQKYIYQKHYEAPNLFNQSIPEEKNCEDICDSFIKTLNSFRDNFIISCFTPNISNEVMWAHYGRNGTGFALQYSAIDIIACGKSYFDNFKHNPNLKNDPFFAPVLYYDEPVCVTNLLKESFDGLLNTIKAINEGSEYQYHLENNPFSSMILHKNNCWSYEQEWRLAVQNFGLFISEKTNEYICIGHCKPTALYLGYNIAESDQKVLTRIANRKSIPVYKMKPSTDNNRYELIGEKI